MNPWPFLVAFNTALVSGIFITELSQPTGHIFLLLFFLVLAQLIQSRLFGWHLFPLERSAIQEGIKNSEIYFKGSYLGTNMTAKKEKKFLEAVYETSKPLLSKLCIATLIVAFFLISRKLPHSSSLSVTVVIQLAAILSIIPIASHSHYMLPLFLSICAFILGLNPSAAPFLSTLYCLALFATCALHRWQQKNLLLGERGGGDPHHDRSLKSGLVLALVFVLIYFFCNLLLPDPEALEKQLLYKAADKVNHAVGRQMERLAKRGNVGKPGHDRKVAQENPSASGQPSSSTSQDQQGGESRQGQVPSGGSGGPTDSQANGGQESKGAQGPNGGGTNPPQSQGSAQGQDNGQSQAQSQSQSQPQSQAQSQSQSQSQSSSPGSNSQQGHQGIENQMKSSGKTESAKEDVKNRPSQGEHVAGAQGSETQEKKTGSRGESNEIFGDAKEASGATEKATAQTSQSRESKPISDPKLISDAFLMALLNFFKVFAVVGVGWALLWYFTRPAQNKKSKKVVPKLTKEEKQQMSLEFEKMMDARLEGREGIIKKYELFLKLMAAAQTPKEDFLPPLDYSQQLSRLWPSHKVQFENITLIFSDTFYGNHQPTSSAVREFDGSFKTLVSSFLR